jgi:hypothetical protein
MTSTKPFIVGVLIGTLLGATFLGALSHLLVIGLAVLGAGAVALHGMRRRLLGRSEPKSLRT